MPPGDHPRPCRPEAGSRTRTGQFTNARASLARGARRGPATQEPARTRRSAGSWNDRANGAGKDQAVGRRVSQARPEREMPPAWARPPPWHGAPRSGHARQAMPARGMAAHASPPRPIPMNSARVRLPGDSRARL